MKPKSITFICSIAMLFHACTASINSQIHEPEIRLSRQYHRIAIITNGTGSSTASIISNFNGQLNTAKVMHGNEQLIIAAQSMAFECGKLGFQVVSEEDNPDLIMEFMIGSIRQDEITGWIADAGYITLSDARTKRVVAQYEAKTMFITPTVNNIITKLASEMKNIY